MWDSQQDFIGIYLVINGDLNNNERVLASFFISCLFVGKNWLRKKHSSLLFILMLCLSGERFLRGLPISRASSEEIEIAQAG